MSRDEKTRFQALLEDPAYEGHPLRDALARAVERNEKLERRMERVARMGDNFERELRQAQDALRLAHSESTAALEPADYVRAMLPPSLQGAVRTAWHFTPAKSFQGGALGYRWLPGERQFALFVLDVTGSGLRAALLALAVLRVLHARELEGASFDAPASVVAALHERFPQGEHGGLRTSLLYAVYDAEARTLRWCGTEGVSGVALDSHEGGLRQRSLHGEGSLLGADVEEPRAERSMPVQGPTRVLLFTDAALERKDAKGEVMLLPGWLERQGGRALSLDLGPLLDELAQGLQRPEDDRVLLGVELVSGAPRASATKGAGTGPMDDEQELAWVEALLARREQLELVESDQLGRRFVRLMRRLGKLTRISDAYQSELRRSNLELEKLNSDLDQFAGRAAHDLKAPLASVVGFASMLASEQFQADPGQVREFAREITGAGERMVELIDGLLTLARVRQEDLQLSTVDLGAALRGAMQRLRSTLDASGALLELPERWPAALGHPAWLEAVLANLLSNALKYGGRPPRVWIEATRTPEGLVRCSVRDNGPGLDAAQRKRLFKPFSRMHAARGEGHGLGLTIVQRAVERLGGAVSVDSEPGAGTTFSFTLQGA